MTGRRTTRTRQIESDDAFARVEVADAPRTGVAVLQITSTPAGVQGYYGVQATDVSGDEVEGGAVTLAAAGNTFYAANVGASAPAVGDYVIARQVDAGRWAFRHG